ncbi:hypothetical protein Scep_003582 [Stephania cephalantha]|uniref:Uncharacterized protein n=1 Tax=Stephania cephalantha TaxID=152367 RepID=A0AAP0KS89_9MAGN
MEEERCRGRRSDVFEVPPRRCRLYAPSVSGVTKSGCLTVHDFEALYCLCNNSLGGSHVDDERKHLMHIFVLPQLDVVRWNLANQDEEVASLEMDILVGSSYLIVANALHFSLVNSKNYISNLACHSCFSSIWSVSLPKWVGEYAACTSMTSNEIHIFDIGLISTKPIARHSLLVMSELCYSYNAEHYIPTEE